MTSKYTVIKASAGSGKTYRLTEELTERLARVNADGTPEIRPSDIIATTFTRKAAAELSGRIRERLVDEGQLSQAAAMPTALIGTVNSITGRILQEFAVDAGRSPELAVLSETSQARAFSLAVDNDIAEAEDAHRELLVRMGYDLGPTDDPMYNPGRMNWGKTVRDVIELARANDISPDDFGALAETSLDGLFTALDDAAADGTAAGSTSDARGAVLAAVRDAVTQLRSDLSEGTIKGKSVGPVEELIGPAENFILTQTTIPGARERLTWKEWFAAAKGDVPRATRKATKPWGKAFADAVPASVFATDPALRSDLAELTRLVFTTAATCMGAYDDYKSSLGLIDFADQEQLTLHLLRDDSDIGRAVRETIAARFRILVVDEFQDTSPLQLALFTELGNLVDEVIWVGDPKQSIYGFRGADPSLMTSALEAITAEGGRTDILHHSWRTHATPLDLSNRLFSRVFPGEPDAANPGLLNTEVWLDVPEPLADKHAGDDPGDVQVWTPAQGAVWNAKAPWFTRIARGLQELEQAEGVPDKGRAVLTRSNRQADDLRVALRAWGIPTEGGGTPLLETREGATVRAACAWLRDPADTQALVELIAVLNEHPAHMDWFTTLTSATESPDLDARRAHLAAWSQDESLAGLAALRPALPQLTVMQTVVAVIDALDLRYRVASWKNPVDRTAAINGILNAVTDYESDAAGAGLPVTLSGFLTSLDPDSHERDNTVPTTSSARNPAAIVVSTIHQAKGLEWDTVVVAPPLYSDRFRAAGVWVDSPTQLSLSAPLAGRELRFWPETLLNSDVLKTALSETPVQEERREAEQLEEMRLLYVAMTRSRRRTVLAPHRTLGDLAAFKDTGFGLNEVSMVEDAAGDADADGDGTRTGVQVLWSSHGSDGDEQDSDFVDCEVRAISHDKYAFLDILMARGERPPHPSALIDDERQPAPRTAESTETDMLSATFTASAVEATPERAGAATITLLADLGDALVEGGGKDWNKVGDCVHSYLAAPLDDLTDDRKHALVARLVESWNVGDRVSADDVVEAGERWITWLHEQYPGATVESEVPFTWTNGKHQRAEGWLDELVTLPDGRRVIVDHKTFPGADPITHIRDNYIGQMDTYRQALTDIDGAEPAAILIHLPLAGKVVEVR